MATKIVTKNSSTASAVPTASDLVQGELAVNVADKRLFTEDNAGAIVELGTNPSGNVTFQDNGKAIFGAGSDLEIYHNGSNSIIRDVGTGDLRVQGANLQLLSSNGKKYLYGVEDAYTKLYYDNAEKLATTATGIDVTGTATMDGLTSTTSSSMTQLTVNGTGAIESGINFASGGTTYGQIYFNNVSPYDMSVLQQYSTGSLIFGTNDTERLRIDSAGNVGIGTSSPASLLHLAATAPVLSFTDTNSFTDANDRFIVRASSDKGNIQWYDDSTSTTSELMTFLSSGNVGIGTSSPSYKADILATNQYALRLNTTDADGCFLAIQTNGTPKGYLGTSHHLVAGTPSENDITLRAENNLQFTTGGGTERMRIDSSGNLLVGHTSAEGDSSGTTLYQNGQTVHKADGAYALELVRSTSDGDIAVFRKDNTTVGSIGNYGGLALDVGKGTTAVLRFRDSLNAIYPAAGVAGGTSDGVTSLGISSGRFKDLYLSGAVNAGSVVQTTSSTGLAGDFTNTNTSGYGLRVTTYGTGAQYGFAVDSYGGGYSRDFIIGVDGYIYSMPTYGLTTSGSANMFVATDGSFQRSVSSARYKNTITDATHGLTELLTLRPVTYKGNNDADTVFGGLIAEEVHDAGLTEFVQYNEEGEPDALAYSNMVSLCIKAIQEQQNLIESLTTRIAALEE